MALPARHRFTVEEYELMGRTGILGPDDRVELLDGEVVEMAPIGPPHASTVSRLIALFSRTFGARAIVGAQNPVVLSRFSEPQPDLALLRSRSDFYGLAHPVPDDILLVVEVADTTLASDRARKLPLYAAAGVAEAWVVDVNSGTVEAYWDPSPTGYHQSRTAARGSSIAPRAFPDDELAVEEVVG